MTIVENVNLNATLQITDSDKNVKPVIAINSNLVNGGNNLNLSFTVIDADALTNNVVAVQAEMDSFLLALNAKMVEFGYQVKI